MKLHRSETTEERVSLRRVPAGRAATARPQASSRRQLASTAAANGTCDSKRGASMEGCEGRGVDGGV